MLASAAGRGPHEPCRVQRGRKARRLALAWRATRTPCPAHRPRPHAASQPCSEDPSSRARAALLSREDGQPQGRRGGRAEGGRTRAAALMMDGKETNEKQRQRPYAPDVTDTQVTARRQEDTVASERTALATASRRGEGPSGPCGSRRRPPVPAACALLPRRAASSRNVDGAQAWLLGTEIIAPALLACSSRTCLFVAIEDGVCSVPTHGRRRLDPPSLETVPREPPQYHGRRLPLFIQPYVKDGFHRKILLSSFLFI